MVNGLPLTLAGLFKPRGEVLDGVDPDRKFGRVQLLLYPLVQDHPLRDQAQDPVAQLCLEHIPALGKPEPIRKGIPRLFQGLISVNICDPNKSGVERIKEESFLLCLPCLAWL